MVEQSAVNRLVVGSSPSWGGLLLIILKLMSIFSIELYLYTLQQELNNFLIEQINTINPLSFLTILIGGVLTSFNPCMVSSIPMAIGYINKQSYKILYSLYFILGILSSLITVSLVTLFAKTSYKFLSDQLPIIGAILIIFVGLNVLNIIEFKFPYINQNNRRDESFISILKIYSIGLSLGVNLSPCATPILMTVITWISLTKHIVIGFILLSIYCLGYMLPIVISISSVNHFRKIKSISIYSDLIISVAGCIIISMGTFSLCHEFFLLV